MARGSSSRSGPAPDPNALRRDRDQKEWINLPAEGRKGKAPEWPLSDPSLRELALWEREWKRPQALMWEANGQENEVALYVRSLEDAENPEASVAARQLIKQQMEALGISIPGLRANRWIIGEPPVARANPRPPSPDRQSAKDRVKVIQGGAA